MIHAEYEGTSDHRRKNTVGFIFFLQCGYLHIHTNHQVKHFIVKVNNNQCNNAVVGVWHFCEPRCKDQFIDCLVYHRDLGFVYHFWTHNFSDFPSGYAMKIISYTLFSVLHFFLALYLSKKCLCTLLLLALKSISMIQDFDDSIIIFVWLLHLYFH